MARIITHADISTVPDGGMLELPEGAQLTPLAAERARARGITVHTVREAVPPGLIEEVTQKILFRLGALGGAQVQHIEHLVTEVVRELSGGAPGGAAGTIAGIDYCAAYLEQERARQRRRAVITTTGRNAKGIVARITAAIADLSGDILDISQTLVGDYFTMILVVDTASLNVGFAEFKARLEEVTRELQIQCMVMHEDVVTSLSRV
jgi:ACT domain-containing protein